MIVLCGVTNQMKRFLLVIACLLLISCASTGAPNLTGMTERPIGSHVFRGSKGHGVEVFFFVLTREGKKIVIAKLADGTIIGIDPNPGDPQSELLFDTAFCPIGKKIPENVKPSGKFIPASQCPKRVEV